MIESRIILNAHRVILIEKTPASTLPEVQSTTCKRDSTPSHISVFAGAIRGPTNTRVQVGADKIFMSFPPPVTSGDLRPMVSVLRAISRSAEQVPTAVRSSPSP